MYRGSPAEVGTQLLLAERLCYPSSQDIPAWLPSFHSVARQLQSLKKALATRIAVDPPFPVPRSPFPA
jgi:hypothetical protein